MWVLGLQVDFPVRKAAAPGTLENTVQTTVVYSDTLVRRTLSITLNKHHEMVSRCRAYSKWQNSHLWEFSYNNFVILSLKLKKNKQSICKLLNHVNALCLLETLMTRQLQGDNTCYKWSLRGSISSLVCNVQQMLMKSWEGGLVTNNSNFWSTTRILFCPVRPIIWKYSAFLSE